jgi:class 3 adenylate cyclase
VERKLTTILAADVVGYAALMERDEQGTHERLKAGRKELFEPEIARHHGHVFKLMGDGMLAEFGSVVDAVECAVSLQRGLTERNANVPADQRVQVRIGINLGEVIVEGDDRYGEGVNIAARLEQIADSGGICVSGKVAKEVEKKLAFGFEPMGVQKVKNIAEPVQAFRVKLDGMPIKRMAPISPRRAALGGSISGYRHRRGTSGDLGRRPEARRAAHGFGHNAIDRGLAFRQYGGRSCSHLFR